MNIRPENVVVNSCEYTPVYLIPNSGVPQRGSYYLASNTKDVQVLKPVSDNLKRFYENSGNLESNVISSPKPRILKKQTNNVYGNNLKLASFLLPKTEPQIIQSSSNVNVNIPSKTIERQATNVVLKPSVTTVNATNCKIVDNCSNEPTTNCVNTPTLPIMEVDRKIVRVGNIATTSKFTFPKVPPKLLPKEPLPPSPVASVSVPIVPVTTASKTTSVQLIKLGQTYHSLNRLSDEQMRIVNKALQLFSNGGPKEPTYEPEANPKFIYKLVSTKDLNMTSRSKLVSKKRGDIKKSPVKRTEKKEPKQDPLENEEIQAEPKVTRSGRTVKQSRHIRLESPQKPKKKISTSRVHCFQCLNEFTSLYRLQRHYENFPTHIPERVHSNLFHCLQAILKGSTKENQAYMFVQQLDQMIQKLRSLLPCLLKKMDGCEGSPCNISNEIGGLFGMSPGRYNLNIEALTCIKDTEGHCIHNPPPPKAAPIPNITIHSRVRMTNEESHANSENEDCARINSVDKWPTISKRILSKKKAAAENFQAKRIRLTSENGDGIELSIDDVVTLTEPQEQILTEQQNMTVQPPQMLVENPKTIVEAPNTLAEVSKPLDNTLINLAESPQELVDEQKISVSKVTELSPVQNENDPSYNEEITEMDITESTSTDQNIVTHPVKFYSTHFDIRSSPIKLPSALAKKFQIKPEEASSYEVQILRPLINENELSVQNQNHLSNSDNVVQENEGSLSNDVSFSLDQMFPDNEIPKEVLNELNDLSFQSNIFDSPLTKALKEMNHYDQSLDKQNLFDPNLYVNSDANIEPTVSLKDQVDGYFEPAAIHVKMEKPNGVRKSALSHVKERSKILFEFIPSQEQINTVDQLQLSQKSLNLFDKASSNLYEPSAILKGNGFSRSQLPSKNNGIFESGIKHSKDDTLISSSMIDDKSNDMMVQIPSMICSDPSLLEKPTSIIDSSLMDDKHLSDLNHSDFSSNDARLLSNQGQSVLHFLESLSNDCLVYPETEIRNNTEDFQLDLFSFTT